MAYRLICLLFLSFGAGTAQVVFVLVFRLVALFLFEFVKKVWYSIFSVEAQMCDVNLGLVCLEGKCCFLLGK